MASRQQLKNTLAELVRAQARQGPLPTPSQSNSITQELLSIRPGIQPYSETPPTFHQEDPRGPSPVNRLIDVLSRPLYGVMNVAEEFVSEDTVDLGEIGSSLWQGISGKEKTLGSDVLEAAGVENDVVRGIAGFGLDVLGDPLTYLGLGLVSKLGRGATRSVEALGKVEDVSQEASRQIAESIQRRAAEGVIKTPAPEDPPRLFTAGPGPQRAALPAGEPPTVPPVSASIASSADTIATPVAKPQSGREILEDLLKQESEAGSKARERLIKSQLKRLPQQETPVARRNVVTMLNDLAESEKSPPVRNMILSQARKVEANVNPAETLVGQAGLPIQRPPLRGLGKTAEIKQKRVNAATEIADDFLKVNKFDEIDHRGQSNLWNRIVNWMSKNRVRKVDRPITGLSMLRIAENRVLESGRKLVDQDGNTLRLSDVGLKEGEQLTNETVDAFRQRKPRQSIEAVKAQSAQEIANEVVSPTLQLARRFAQPARGLPPARAEFMGSELSRALGDLAKQAGASKHEASKAKAFIKELFDFNQDELYSKVEQQARNMMRITVTGENNPEAIQRVGQAVYEALGKNPKILGREIPQNSVVEGIMTRFATWWNAKDLRPFAKEYIDTARNIAAAFEKAMAPLVRNTSPSARTNAWRIAQGHMEPSSDFELELANRFKTMVERLMGSEGVTTNAGNSVTTRAGVTMQQLNRELARANSKLRFTNNKGVDELGREFDYTGENWLNSWKQWDTEEPAEAIYELTRALQMATRKNAFLDDAALRWGSPVVDGEFNTPVAGIPRLDGFYFPKEIATQLKEVWNRLESDTFRKGPKGLQMFDTLQRSWKSGVTIYSPSHHIRNLNGDIFLNMLDGVIFTRDYTTAAKVLFAHKRRYRDLEFATNMTDPKWRRVAATQPGDTVLTTGGGHKLTAEQIMMAAEEQGFLARTAVLEDLFGEKVPFGLPGRARGRAHGAASAVSENRDHWVRLAHFIHLLRKDKSKNLRDAISKASRRVKKFHPDGSDLTGFEQTFMRRIIPFYSWLRKSTPLIIEGMVMRPHISLAMPKAMGALQEMTGVEAKGPGDPFPIDSLFPEWIKEKGIGPIIPPDSPFAALGRQQTWQGDTPGYTIINPTSPFMDQMTELLNPTKTVISGATPAVRLPIEILTGTTALGIPLERAPGGLPGHLAMQVPPVGIGARISGLTRAEEPWHPEQLINWLLTGGLVRGTGPYEQQAKIEIEEMLREIGRANQEAMK